MRRAAGFDDYLVKPADLDAPHDLVELGLVHFAHQSCMDDGALSGSLLKLQTLRRQMSINYYAIPVRDPKRVGPIVEGADTATTIDEAKVRAALSKRFKGGDRGTLTWEAGGDYVFVDVLPTHVLVTHNSGRGSYQIDVIMAAIETLQGLGLHVWDPQQGSWYP